VSTQMIGAVGDVYPLPEGVAGTPAVALATHVDAVRVSRVGQAYEVFLIGGTVDTVPDPSWSAPLIPDASWEPGEEQTEDDRPMVADPEAVHPQLPRFKPIRKPTRQERTQVIPASMRPAFLQWCVQERGRAVDSDGHVEYIERDELVYALGLFMQESN
jgi:hypothetical protein